MKYIPVYLAGRCRSGSDSTGTVIHAIEITGDDYEVCGDPGPALCGREPGRRSAGWYSLRGCIVTCPKCRKLMAQECEK